MSRVLDVAVIGAGIVGVAAASWLQRDGHRVTLVDPAPPGQGASFGNAGCFSPSSIVPLSAPGMLRHVPGWLADPNGPLALRWAHVPAASPWLIRFLRAGTHARTLQQAEALARLLAPAFDSLRPLLADAGSSHLLRRDGSLIVYRTAAGWAGSQAGWDLRRRNGITWEELGPDALQALDPALDAGLHRGVLLPGNGHTTDPHALVLSLAETFIRNGGTILAAKATGFDVEDSRLRAVQTSSGPLPAHAAVLAAGVHARPLARMLGDRLPLESERGYHLDVGALSAMPRLPTVSAEDRFVATPMANGLRLTGVVELAGLSAPPDWRRAHALLTPARRLFPGLGDAPSENVSVWMGHRPSFPDSLPVIGHSRRTRDIVYAFGHGHLGLTGAPFTGRLVADLISGRPPSTDLAAFSPRRFSRTSAPV